MIIAEIGINHNGDIELAKKLIDGAAFSGADIVKFQKRTIDIVYTKEYLDSPRESPWGNTQRMQKEGIEFGKKEYDEINKYCKNKIEWFASAWDIKSLEFLRQYDLSYNKVASAMLGNIELLEEIAKEDKHTFISTGMSTMDEVEKVVGIFDDCRFELMYCNSVYPSDIKEIDLRLIRELRKKFKCFVGYSGHELGIAISSAAHTLGASSIERHITLDRSLYGSDQSASLEINQFAKMIKNIKAINFAMGDGRKVITEKEKEVRKKLRWYE